jgi:hypothetical protein
MPTISVRISEQDKKRLLKHGALSKSIREALDLYLNTKQTQELLARLEKLQQRNTVKTTSAEEVRLINEDRNR